MEPSTASFLDSLASLTHHQRMERLVALGRSGDPLLDALARGDAWCRRLAAWAGYGHRDPARILPALSDPSRGVRATALKVAVRVLDDTALRRALDLVRAPRLRKALIVGLARRGRTGPVDAWLEPRLGEGGRWLDLLPWAGAALVRRHAGAFAELGSLDAWRRLARWQPELALDLLAARLAGRERVDPRLAQQAVNALDVLVAHHPDLALRLVPDLLRRGMSPQEGPWLRTLQALARRRPAGLFDALRKAHQAAGRLPVPGAFLRVSFDRGAERLGGQRIAWLVEHAWTALPDGKAGIRWYLRLSPEERRLVRDTWLERGRGAWGAFLLRFVAEQDARREPAFARWAAAARNRAGHMVVEALRWLPGDLRAREARRHLADPELAIGSVLHLGYAALLPFAEARVAVAAAVGHPEGEVRARAASACLSALDDDRDALPEALGWVHLRRFEQDPVCLAMLSALAALSPGAWARTRPLDALEAVLDDAWSAADLSPASGAQAEQLIVRAFRLDPDRGARLLQRSLQVRGVVHAPGLLVGLPKAALDPLLPHLEALAGAWLSRERWFALAWLCQNLQRDLARSPALVATLQDVAREVPFAGYAAAALGILRRFAPSAFGALAAELVEKDASTALIPDVARYVATRRQDLLDRVLAVPSTGRYATGKTGVLPPFDRGFATWTRGQQERYADAVLAVVRDAERDMPSVLPLVRRLAELAYVDPEPLVALAADPRQPVRETAVRALGRLDGPAAVPALVTCLGDGRARWAIYALRHALSEMSAEEALAHLMAAPRSRVTVAKEVVRLVGELGGEEGHRALLALAAEDLHCDVRIALLRALWAHLEREETWSVFEAAARDPDPVLASRLAEVATGALSTTADRRYCALLARLLDRPEAEARLRLVQTCQVAPLRDPDRVLLEALLRRVSADTTGERKVALEAVLTRGAERDVPRVVAAILRSLERPDALADHVETLAGGWSWRDPRREGVRDALRPVLARSAWAAPLVLRLAVRLDEKALVALLRDLASRGLLGFDAQGAAIAAIGTVVAPDQVEAALRGDGDPALQRLGLAALERAAAGAGGWTAGRLAALETYRAVASPLVAGPARLVRVPPAA